jgi:hypothetical protein
LFEINTGLAEIDEMVFDTVLCQPGKGLFHRVAVPDPANVARGCRRSAVH